jgi:hypothetical protein
VCVIAIDAIGVIILLKYINNHSLFTARQASGKQRLASSVTRGNFAQTDLLMGDSMPKPLAIIRTTDDLRRLFRLRVAQLNISLETLDLVAGLPTRYSQVLLGPEPRKHFGAISFDALLGALAVELVAMEDKAALARIQRRLEPLERIDHTGWRADLRREQIVAAASCVFSAQ